jgi:DNA gyrase subunit A
VNLLQLGKDEQVTSALIVKSGDIKGKFLVMGTKKGFIKKTAFEDFANVRRNGLIAIKLRDGDSLNWVKQVDDKDEIVMVTKSGKSIKFPESDARPMGRSAQGVIGIRIKAEDELVEMDVISTAKAETAKLLVVMENGLGKSSDVASYRSQHRGGTGVLTAKVTAKTGKVIGAIVLTDETDSDIILLSKEGQVIRLNTKNIPTLGRATQGVYVMRMNKDDRVVSMSILPNQENIIIPENLSGEADSEKPAVAEQETLVELED